MSLPDSPTAPRPSSRAPRAALLLVVAGLLLTAQERTFGAVTDEQQILGTAVALVETRTLGLPRGHAFAVPRAQGDALAPYGVGAALAFVPAVALAHPWERTFGPGTSQSLLLLVPLALVAVSAAFAGRLAREMGATGAGQALAIVGTGLASPLWPLGSTAFSEPLLAACLAGAAAFAVRAARREERGVAERSAPGAGARSAVAAGVLAGLAVLTKGLALAVAPGCLLPLAVATLPLRSRGRLLGWAAAGAAPGLGTWLVLEVARFGRPLASYGGQHFSHPLLDGWWRLTVGPNEGLFVYFPFALLALPALASSKRLRAGLAGVLVPVLALVSLVAAWWAWDGSAGWGPRLIAPTIPLLAAAAGCWAGECARRIRVAVALVALGFGVNLLGLVQPDVSVMAYVDSCGPALVRDADVGRWPEGLAAQFPPGQRRISQSMAAVTDPAFAPIRLHARLIARRLERASAEAEWRQALVSDPPWRSARPDLVPDPAGVQGQLSGVLFNLLVDPPAWPHWGASLTAEPQLRRTRFVAAWLDALDDQVLRALDVGQPGRAVRLAARLLDVAPRDRSAALLAESLRADGRLPALDALLAGLPERTLGTADIVATRALMARDAGDEPEARRRLETLAAMLDTPGIRRSLAEPLAAWPATTRPWLSPDAPWR